MRVLALDVGEKRIGVALSDPAGMVAWPLSVIEHRSREADFAAIVGLVAEHGAELVVVGRPLTLRGEVGPQAQRVEQYAQALTEALPVPLRLWDERYSTKAAEDVLRQTRKRGRHVDRGEVDAVAAAVILQGFLESQGG